ncbi:MAG: DUF1080 domain-containing protein [Chitinophagales bacterium]
MQKKIITVVFIALLFSCSSSHKSTDMGLLTKEEKNEGWQLLFDGATTKGWHKYGGAPIGAAWKVTDSALHLDPSVKGGGDISSDEEFENFDLKLEWKISKNGNSGIMFYVHEDSAKYHWPWETGPEMQVLDNIGAEDNKKEDHLAGTLYDLLGKAENSKPKIVGEWNQAEIKCINGKLDLYLNGINIVSTVLWDDYWKAMVTSSKFRTMPGFGTYKKGHISLQDHGNEVWFRNIKIRRL